MNSRKAIANGLVLARGDTVQHIDGYPITFAYVADDGQIATQESGEMPLLWRATAFLDLHVESVDENGRRSIDLTPSWLAVLPLLLTAYRDGNPKGRAIALDELRRMARIADSAVNAPEPVPAD